MENAQTENSAAGWASELTAGLGGWELPNGWVIDRPDYMPDCVIVGVPRSGFVTVDLHQRIFGLGQGKPRAYRDGMTFKGGNWRLRLMSAAEDYLRATLDA